MQADVIAQFASYEMLDLSQPWGADTLPFPGQAGPEVVYEKRLTSHRVNVQRITTTLHTGTHIDAPLHFVSGGADIEALSLETLVGPILTIDISGDVSDGSIFTSDVLDEHASSLQDGDGLFMHTGYSRFALHEETPDEERYFFAHPGPDASVADWCLRRGVRILGVDVPAMDHPMNTVMRRIRPDIAERLSASTGIDWDRAFPHEDFQLMHTRLFPHGLVHIENLSSSLKVLAGHRTVIGAFPWRFRGGEGAMCRVVAFLPRGLLA